MGSIRLPQAQLSELPPIRKKNSQTDLIMQVLGNNPFAQGINQAAPSIADALTKRADIRRKATQTSEERDFQKELLRIKHEYDMEENTAKVGGDFYTAEQLNAIETGNPSLLPSVYPNGRVPKDAVNLLSTISNRKTVDFDRDAARRLREEQEGTRTGDREKARYRNYVLDMEQRDPIIKNINTKNISLGAVDSLKNLIKGGNTTAFSALGIQMAKGMGEVGVMTDSDVIKYVRSGQISQKSGDILLTWLEGRPTEATLGEIGDIVKAMKLSYQDNYQPRIDQYIDSYSAIENLRPEELAKRLSLDYGGGKKAISTPERKATLKWNPNTGKLESVK